MPDPRNVLRERLCWRTGVQPDKADELLDLLAQAGLTVELSELGGGRVTPPALGNPSGPVQETSATVLTEPLAQCKGQTADEPTDTRKVLGRRVDALYLAFELELDPARVPELFDPENPKRRVWVSPSGSAFQIRNTRTAGVVLFDNADLRAKLDIDDETGFGLEVIARATYLATETVERCLANMQRLADDLGVVKGIRVRRLDLAVDIAGFELDGIELGAWIVQRRAGLVDYAEVPVELHHQAERVTGFTVGKGALRMRIYDKRQELRFRADSEKTAVEESAWKAAGWNGADCVSRVEFQLRGVAMDQLELRDSAALSCRLDPVWQYLVREWVRLAVPDTATRRKNWKLDDRWKIVRTVRFVHESRPADRQRRRGGARIRYARGCMLSAVVARVDPGPPIAPREPETKLVGDQAPGQDEQLARAVRANDRRIGEFFLQEASEDRLREWGPAEAYRRQVQELNALRARFWSSRDGPLEVKHETASVVDTQSIAEVGDGAGIPPGHSPSG